jgi:hypothetical protein
MNKVGNGTYDINLGNIKATFDSKDRDLSAFPFHLAGQQNSSLFPLALLSSGKPISIFSREHDE